MSRPITDIIRHIYGGVFHDKASREMSELVTLVEESGKSGKLILEITLKKATRGGAMHVSGKSRLTKPAEAPMESIMFESEGDLVADDPRQQKLELKSVGDVNASPKELKTVNQ